MSQLATTVVMLLTHGYN